MGPRRLYLVVATCALVVYAGALWNRFALDDLYIIVHDPRVHSLAGVWRVFAEPYWPPDFGGKMYRPLVLASFALDWTTASTAWFHLVNVLWHAGAAVLVAALARRWAGDAAALVAGVVFAVHPVHVEAVANVVGRAELMATVFALLSLYAALERRSVAWSAAALLGGLLSKENAAVVPGLVAWAWILGIGRPSRRDMLRFAVSWALIGAAYAAARWAVLHPFARYQALDPVFLDVGPVVVRLTAVAALADVTRLLVFPLTLRMEYSPNERTAVDTPLDLRFFAGLVCFAAWVALLVRAYRRGRKVEAFGLGAIAIAYLPVANLLFPVGVLIAERTLYLPSVGLCLALGGWGRVLDRRPLALLLGLVGLAVGARTALRVPAWRDDRTATMHILEDSPRSYRGPARTGAILLSVRRHERALDALRTAIRIYDRDPRNYYDAADAAFTLGRTALADSLLTRAEQRCFRCLGYYRVQAASALARGDTVSADSLLARARALAAQ